MPMIQSYEKQCTNILPVSHPNTTPDHLFSHQKNTREIFELKLETTNPYDKFYKHLSNSLK